VQAGNVAWQSLRALFFHIMPRSIGDEYPADETGTNKRKA